MNANQTNCIASQPRNAVNDAAIVSVKQEEGKTYVVYADGSRRQVTDWSEGWAMMKAGQTSRTLLGL